MPIMPNLRSVLAQVHRKSRRIGSHRNFSTSSPPDYEETLSRLRPHFWLITRSLGLVVGYYSASYYVGDPVAKHEAWLIEDLRKAEREEN